MDDAEGINPEVFEAHFARNDYGVLEGLGEGGYWNSLLVSGQRGESGGYDSLLAPAVGEGKIGCGAFQFECVCEDQFGGCVGYI